MLHNFPEESKLTHVSLTHQYRLPPSPHNYFTTYLSYLLNRIHHFLLSAQESKSLAQE